jgi:hypothetical protein
MINQKQIFKKIDIHRHLEIENQYNFFLMTLHTS